MAGMGLVGSGVMATGELRDSKKDMVRNLEWRDLFLRLFLISISGCF